VDGGGFIALGVLIASLIGGVGIAAFGGATAAGVWLYLALMAFFGLIGNKIGSVISNRAERRRP
jgi:hypothetical protein